MAKDFSAAAGNMLLKNVSQKNDKMLNTQDIVQIEISLIRENPDNDKIFNMDNIHKLAKTIKEEGFSGAIEVYPIEDEHYKYEISSGHRRFRAMQLLEREVIPAIITKKLDPVHTAQRLLSSNINNRVLTAMDYCRAIDYYITYVLKPQGYGGDTRQRCADFFSISRTQVYRYQALGKLIPELQEMVEDPSFPYTKLDRVGAMTKEMQTEVYNEICSWNNAHPEDLISAVRLAAIVDSINEKHGRTKKQPSVPVSAEVKVEDKADQSPETHQTEIEKTQESPVGYFTQGEESSSTTIIDRNMQPLDNISSSYDELSVGDSGLKVYTANDDLPVENSATPQKEAEGMKQTALPRVPDEKTNDNKETYIIQSAELLKSAVGVKPSDKKQILHFLDEIESYIKEIRSSL